MAATEIVTGIGTGTGTETETGAETGIEIADRGGRTTTRGRHGAATAIVIGIGTETAATAATMTEESARGHGHRDATPGENTTTLGGTTIGIRAEGTGIGAAAEGVETVGDAWGGERERERLYQAS